MPSNARERKGVPSPCRVLTRVAVCLGLVFFVAVTASEASAERDLSAAAFARIVRSGAAPVTGVRVVGDVALGSHVVRRLSCRNCQFEGDLIASGSTVEETVDLAGSTVAGELDLSAAALKGGMHARGTTFNGIVDLRGAQMGGNADFSQATFAAPVLIGLSSRSAARTTFAGDADFSLATFANLAMLEKSVFVHKVDFTLAKFKSDAVFAAVKAFHQATFTRATFDGAADYSESTFYGPSTFEGARFENQASFRLASFIRRTVFDGTGFGNGVTFLGAHFPKNASRDDADSFDGVQADGDLNFAFATFSRPVYFLHVVATGAFSFVPAALGSRPILHFEQVSADDFGMDVDSAMAAVEHDQTTDDRPAVLGLIESSARARDDLASANKAHYERQVLMSQHYPWWRHFLDFVFYRGIAGYFVRPFQPLIVLLALASVFTLFRMARARKPSAAPVSPRRSLTISYVGARVAQGADRAARALLEFISALLATLTLIAPARKGSEPEREGRQIELWVYRVLFACALIGLANSNPTLRDMFDAVH